MLPFIPVEARLRASVAFVQVVLRTPFMLRITVAPDTREEDKVGASGAGMIKSESYTSRSDCKMRRKQSTKASVVSMNTMLAVVCGYPMTERWVVRRGKATRR